MATLSRTQFERALIAKGLVDTRNRASSLANLIENKMRGVTSKGREGFSPLVPMLLNKMAVAGPAEAREVAELAQQWLGHSSTPSPTEPKSRPLTLAKLREIDDIMYDVKRVLDGE